MFKKEFISYKHNLFLPHCLILFQLDHAYPINLNQHYIVDSKI